MGGIAPRAFESRILHNESFSVATDFPADADLHLRFQGLRDKTLVEPDETDLSARISKRGFGKKHFLFPGASGFDVYHFPNERAFFIGGEGIDGTNFRIVLVAVREMVEHIAHAKNLQTLEFAEC